MQRAFGMSLYLRWWDTDAAIEYARIRERDMSETQRDSIKFWGGLIGAIALLFGLFAQVGTFAWWASAIVTSQQFQADTLVELKADIDKIQAQITAQTGDRYTATQAAKDRAQDHAELDRRFIRNELEIEKIWQFVRPTGGSP